MSSKHIHCATSACGGMGGTRSSSAAWMGAVAEDSIKCTRAATVLGGVERRGALRVARVARRLGLGRRGGLLAVAARHVPLHHVVEHALKVGEEARLERAVRVL